MRLRNRLSQSHVNGLPPGLHCDGGGLYLQVQYPAGRSWLYRYTLNGKQRWCGLGAAADIPLSQARRLRDKLAVTVKGDKIDIVAERRRERAAARPAVTFRHAAAAFIAGQTHWKDARQAQQWEGSIRD